MIFNLRFAQFFSRQDVLKRLFSNAHTAVNMDGAVWMESTFFNIGGVGRIPDPNESDSLWMDLSVQSTKQSVQLIEYVLSNEFYQQFGHTWTIEMHSSVICNKQRFRTIKVCYISDNRIISLHRIDNVF